MINLKGRKSKLEHVKTRLKELIDKLKVAMKGIYFKINESALNTFDVSLAGISVGCNNSVFDEVEY